MTLTSKKSLTPLTLIKAGAGAGKTYRIQEEITEWIDLGLVQADKILAVTFTNSAANEMRERIRRNLIKKGLLTDANKIQDSTISTIHGFGTKILEHFSYDLGLSPKPRQLNDAEQSYLIRDALDKVESINPLIENLEFYGYKWTYINQTDGVSALKKRLLDVITKLRSIGKGDDINEVQALITLAIDNIKNIYGKNLGKAETLNNILYTAIESLKRVYPDKDSLMEDWGSNGASREFVTTLFANNTNSVSIKKDWGLWAKLQTIATAPKIEKHKHAVLAFAIWEAADKLSIHPGPLNDAINHIVALLEGAGDTLRKYQDLKIRSGLIDFNDMIHSADEILQNPLYLAEISSHYDCLIIDEFQDTNPLQFSLLRKLQQSGLPTLIVGDLKQSIMGFQGSDYRLFKNLLSSQQIENELEIKELTNNWRSTPELMQFINDLGLHLFKENYQPLTVRDDVAYDSELSPVQRLTFSDKTWGLSSSKHKPGLKNEGQLALAKHIAELINKGIQITDKDTNKKRTLKPCDIAVLAPKNKSLQNFSTQLNKFGVQTRLTQQGLLESEAIQWIISALQFVSNIKNHFALLNLLTSDYYQVPLKKALSDFIENKSFNEPIVKLLIEKSKTIRLLDIPSAILMLIDCLSIWEKIDSQEDGEQQRANILKLLHHAKEFQQSQPESLEAMGVLGKNIETFIVWLNESIEQDGFDDLPAEKLNADDVVVLNTIHKAKGLEWPIVMILDAYEESPIYLPGIDTAYNASNVDDMLDSSYVRFLMDFDDKSTKEKMLAELEAKEKESRNNVAYVAFTRAREQVILPWFDGKIKERSIQKLISPLFDRHPDENLENNFRFETKNMVSVDEPDNTIVDSKIKNRFKLAINQKPEQLNMMISPSEVHSDDDKTMDKNISHSNKYSSELDLTHWDELLEANEIGNWIHRFYQIQFMNESMLEQGFNLLPEELSNENLINTFRLQLSDFNQYLKEKFSPVNIKCEASILSTNEQGQTISGSIDMLIETVDGYIIIDHKTDNKMDINKHYKQLLTYAGSLQLDKPVKQVAINWVRFGVMEQIKL